MPGPVIAVASLFGEHRLYVHGLQQLWLMGSVVVASGVLSCSGVWGIFPDQGLKPMSPALQSEFFSIASPGKSLTVSFYFYKFIFLILFYF